MPRGCRIDLACEHSKETSISIKATEFLHQLNDFEAFKSPDTLSSQKKGRCVLGRRENRSRLRCYAVSTGKYLPTFRRSVLPHLGIRLLRNGGNYLPDDMP